MQENPKSGCLPFVGGGGRVARLNGKIDLLYPSLTKEKGDLLSVDHHIVSGQSPGVEEFGTDNAG